MRKILLLLIVMLALILVGCGVSQEEHETMIQERDSFRQERDSLQNEFTTLQENYDSLRIDYETTSLGESTLQNAYDDLRLEVAGFLLLDIATRDAALEAARQIEEISELEEQIVILNAEVETLTDQIDEMQASIIRIAGESRAFPAGRRKSRW